jgi:hypothetical protein
MGGGNKWLPIFTDDCVGLGSGIDGLRRHNRSQKERFENIITAMAPHHRLQLANRIHLGLMRELGQGIDLNQMLNSALYARDVLLVCQGYPDTELPYLGEQFRQATADAMTRRTDWPRDSSGFGLSRPAVGSHSGFDEYAEALADARQPARRWLTPSTWFAR